MARYNTQILESVNNTVKVVPGALVSVCTPSSNLTPVAPITTANADASGNVAITVASGVYDFFVTGSGISTYKFTQTVSPGPEGILYADEFPGVDIGAQINAAYAAAPAAPSCTTIFISPGTYNFTTPILLNTVGKYCVLQGSGSAQIAGTSNVGGTVLNYTPTTATSAITLDWTPATGGGYASGGGLRDFTLVNNPASLVAGGSGSSATGINIGPVNGGAHKGWFTNIRTMGFGVGSNVIDTGVASWGMKFDNCAWAYNNTGMSFAAGEEQVLFVGCTFSVNGTNLNYASTATSGDTSFIGGSIDSASTMGIEFNASNQIFTAIGAHWENKGVAGNVHYTHGTACTITIIGGTAENDNNSGSSTPWFDGAFFNVIGLEVSSAGATLSGFLFTVRNLGNISLYVQSPSVIPPTSIAFISLACTVTTIDSTNGVVTQGAIMKGATLSAVAPTVAAGQIGLGSTTATSATAGANGAVPAQVVGYMIINVAGTAMKVPYFNT